MARYEIDDHTRAAAGIDPAPPDDGSAVAAYALGAVGVFLGLSILGWAAWSIVRQLVG